MITIEQLLIEITALLITLIDLILRLHFPFSWDFSFKIFNIIQFKKFYNRQDLVERLPCST